MGADDYLTKPLRELLDVPGGGAARDPVPAGPGTPRVALDLAPARVLADRDGLGRVVRNFPEAERDRVFDRFFRLDAPRSRDAGGAGLGLALVRELVSAAGGTVVAERSPDGGARLRVRLPAAASSQPDRLAAPA